MMMKQLKININNYLHVGSDKHLTGPEKSEGHLIREWWFGSVVRCLP